MLEVLRRHRDFKACNGCDSTPTELRRIEGDWVKINLEHLERLKEENTMLSVVTDRISTWPKEMCSGHIGHMLGRKTGWTIEDIIHGGEEKSAWKNIILRNVWVFNSDFPD